MLPEKRRLVTGRNLTRVPRPPVGWLTHKIYRCILFRPFFPWSQRVTRRGLCHQSKMNKRNVSTSAPPKCVVVETQPTAPPYFYLFCLHSAFFAMSDSRSFNEEGFLKRDEDTGEHIGVCMPCINTNHLFQMPTGPGRIRTGKGGRNFKRTTRINNSATIGTENPSTPSPPASSPT